MGWTCQACTLINIQNAATKCHVCQTTRTTGASGERRGRAVIDLTDFSPKRNGGSMESNRRRRRRLEQVEISAVKDDKIDKREKSVDGRAVKKQKSKEAAKSKSYTESICNKSTNGDGFYTSNSDERKPKAVHEQGEVFEILSSDDEIDDPKSKPLSFENKVNPKSLDGKIAASDLNAGRIRQNDQLEPSAKSLLLNNNNNLSKSNAFNRNRQTNQAAGKFLSQKSTYAAQQNKTSSYSYDTIKSAVSINDPNTNKNYTSNTGHKEQQKQNKDKPKSLKDYYNKQPKLPVETLMQQAQSILKQRFGHSKLRPLQETAIFRAMQRTNQIIIMATGGGKSICCQLPALVGHGKTNHDCVTIVVCPLIALMVDQVGNLHKRGVTTAACLSGSLSAREKADIYSRLRLEKKKVKNKADAVGTVESKPIHLLYVTPELIKTEKFRSVLSELYEQKRLFQIAIDEAHCVSTWGHDFRGAYKELSWLREEFPDVPVMACTGTATAKVIADIRNILRLDVNDAPCLMGTFNRMNISYEVRFKDSLDALTSDGALMDLTKAVQKQHEIADNAKEPCSGIVYVHKRDDCAYLAAKISKMTGLVCASYHAGLKDAEREDTQLKWTAGSIHVVVATVAFGMGIDLAHVRYVIHWTMAKSLEGFYQESGRAGRDGKPSISIIYYSKGDAEKFAYIIQKKGESAAAKKKGSLDGTRAQISDHGLTELDGMINYCTKPGCRRKYVLEHFGERFDARTQCNKTCDYCTNPQKVENDTKAAECMVAVTNSRHAMQSRKGSKGEERMFYHNPLESDESHYDGFESDGFVGDDDGLLSTIEYAGNDFASNGFTKTNGFVKASSVISKYEKMECQQGKKGGFVNFKARILNDEDEKGSKKQQSIEIPAHLRHNMPDPHAASYNNSKDEQKKQSSAELAAELAELKRQMEAKRAALGSCVEIAKALSVPSLSFKKNR